jgi:hypothetical protein
MNQVTPYGCLRQRREKRKALRVKIFFKKHTGDTSACHCSEIMGIPWSDSNPGYQYRESDCRAEVQFRKHSGLCMSISNNVTYAAVSGMQEP